MPCKVHARILRVMNAEQVRAQSKHNELIMSRVHIYPYSHDFRYCFTELHMEAVFWEWRQGEIQSYTVQLLLTFIVLRNVQQFRKYINKMFWKHNFLRYRNLAAKYP